MERSPTQHSHDSSLAEEERRRRRGFSASAVDGVSPRSEKEPSGSTPLGGVEPDATDGDENSVSKRGGDPDPTAVAEDLASNTTEGDGLAPTTTENEDLAPTTTENEDLAPTTTEDEDRAPTTTEDEDRSTPTTEPTLQPSPHAPDLQSTSGDALAPHPTVPTRDDQEAGFANGHTIPGPGAFTFDGTAKFITPDTINYLETVPGGQHWTEMVRRYLQLEQLPILKGVSSFSTYCLRPHADHIGLEPSTPPSGL